MEDDTWVEEILGFVLFSHGVEKREEIQRVFVCMVCVGIYKAERVNEVKKSVLCPYKAFISSENIHTCIYIIN